MIMPKSDTVTMTRDAWNDVSAYIDKLEKDLEFLNALKACGVDNWDGYYDAVEMVYGRMTNEPNHIERLRGDA